MNSKTILTAILFITTLSLSAQSNYLTIAHEIKLPKDSVESSLLINNLENFLRENIESKNTLTAEKSETAILLGELKEIADKQKNDTSLKPYLQNITPLGDKRYAVQVAFMGIDNAKPYLQSLFDIIAVKENEQFSFATPLVKNTENWNVITEDHVSAYYQSEMSKEFAIQYVKATKEFDKKLGISQPTAYYFCQSCETLPQLLQLSGIQYQKEYNGQNWIMASFDTPEKSFCFYPKRFFDNRTADPHDLFHLRASIAIPKEARNTYMICGCAYLYCGSWQINWTDIQKIFKTRMQYDPKTDWLKLYFDRYNFGENQQRHLLVTQFINALIIQKVEQEQGFSAVIKLLASGNMYQNRTKFFDILNAVAGINEKNFNRKAMQLIDEAMKKIE